MRTPLPDPIASFRPLYRRRCNDTIAESRADTSGKLGASILVWAVSLCGELSPILFGRHRSAVRHTDKSWGDTVTVNNRWVASFLLKLSAVSFWKQSSVLGDIGFYSILYSARFGGCPFGSGTTADGAGAHVRTGTQGHQNTKPLHPLPTSYRSSLPGSIPPPIRFRPALGNCLPESYAGLSSKLGRSRVPAYRLAIPSPLPVPLALPSPAPFLSYRFLFRCPFRLRWFGCLRLWILTRWGEMGSLAVVEPRSFREAEGGGGIRAPGYGGMPPNRPQTHGCDWMQIRWGKREGQSDSCPGPGFVPGATCSQGIGTYSSLTSSSVVQTIRIADEISSSRQKFVSPLFSPGKTRSGAQL